MNNTNIKMLHDKQPCKKCSTPVNRIYRKDNIVNPNQTYYFKSFLKCPKCKSMFMIESEKVLINKDSNVIVCAPEKKNKKVKKTKKQKKAELKLYKIERRKLRKKENKKQYHYNRKLDYNNYINSSEWKAFRKIIIDDRGSICECCDREFESVHIHHIHYNNFKKELRDDVLVLCKGCHDYIHEVVKNPPYSLERFRKLKK